MNGIVKPLLPLVLAGVMAGTVLGTGGCFHHRGMVAVGATVTSLPGDHVVVWVHGTRYYYHRGYFYRPGPGGYVVVHAPMGAGIAILPPGHWFFSLGPDRFAYYHGVFYSWDDAWRRYRVVRAPVGAVVHRLPREAMTRRIGGVEYKEYGGAWYRPVRRGSDTAYEVVRPPRRPGRRHE